MRRRDFIALLGGAVAWPTVVGAQQSAIPVIGFLSGRPLDDLMKQEVAAFRKGLNETGFTEGQNVAIEFRWGQSYDQVPELAADLVRRHVAIIATSGGPVAALAAKGATSTIPIVFVSGFDVVRAGLVASFNRPGGNATGVSFMITALEPKRLELLHELVPAATVIAMLVNPGSPSSAFQSKDVQEAARVIGLQIQILNASSASEIDSAFATLLQIRAGALIVAGDAFFNGRRDQLVESTARHRIPAIYGLREFTSAGGLISYGASVTDVHRQAGIYVGKILKGEKPADLPVMQPTKFELVINLKTAKALGLSVPPGLLTSADEVIE